MASENSTQCQYHNNQCNTNQNNFKLMEIYKRKNEEDLRTIIDLMGKVSKLQRQVEKSAMMQNDSAKIEELLQENEKLKNTLDKTEFERTFNEKMQSMPRESIRVQSTQLTFGQHQQAQQHPSATSKRIEELMLKGILAEYELIRLHQKINTETNQRKTTNNENMFKEYSSPDGVLKPRKSNQYEQYVNRSLSFGIK